MKPSGEMPYPEGQASLRVGAAPGGNRCLFEILSRHGQVLAHVALETPELESLLRSLVDLRATMSEPVPALLDPGTRLAMLANPAWQVSPPARGMDQYEAVLALCHPGLGWQGFLLSRSEALALGQSLIQLTSRTYQIGLATVTFTATPPSPTPT